MIKMKPLISLLVVIITATMATTMAATDIETKKVSIEQGTLEGFKEASLNGREFFSFLGVPFAKPPVGELRFKNPLPAEPWTGVLNATIEREICPQFDMMKIMNMEFVTTGSEDCLYLNVYSSRPNDRKAKMAVMVFIHGGAYILGSKQEYKPYVFLNEDIVLVTIQYRVGPFGFLSTGDSTISGNFGLKDQVMALKWVKNNIDNFGGDPDRVTIFGESAGGGSTHLLMLSPWSKGLFKRVISQSGNALCPWSLTRDEKKNTEELAEELGCSSSNGKDLLKCLQKKEAGDIMTALTKFFEWGTAPVKTLPTVDGDFLPAEPIQLLKQQKYNKVDLMTGITKDEGIVATAMLSDDLLKDLLEKFDKIGPLSLMITDKNAPRLAKKAFDHYLEGRKLDQDTIATLYPMYTDRYFSVWHEVATELHAKDPSINTYRYQLDWKGQITFLSLLNKTSPDGVVSHGDDLFYMFSGGPFFQAPLEDPRDLKLRNIFIKLWTNFAKTGNPTPDDSLGFTWDPATSSSFRQLKLTPEPFMSDYVNTKAKDFWLSLPLTENQILESEESSYVKEEL